MAAMLLPSLYSALLQVERCIAKIIAHEKLETEQLTTIRIALSKLQWYEEGKELFYQDQLFDVESYYIEKDTMIIRGITDTMETEIDLAVNKLIDTSTFDFVIERIGESIFYFTAVQPSHLTFELVQDIFQQHHKDRYLSNELPQVYAPVQTPPPDIFSFLNA